MTWPINLTLSLLIGSAFTSGCAHSPPAPIIIPAVCPRLQLDPAIFRKADLKAMDDLMRYLAQPSPNAAPMPSGKTP